jgi:hypothetical protein
MKIVIISLVIVSLVSGSCRLRGEDEIYLLPNQFKGTVFVFFNQPTGKPVKHENGKRVYEIPEGGVLVTQSPFNEGYHYPAEVFYTADQARTKIPFVIEARDLKHETVQACCISTGKAAKTPSGPWVEYLEFYVGTKEQIDDASSKREKINPADLVWP